MLISSTMQCFNPLTTQIHENHNGEINCHLERLKSVLISIKLNFIFIKITINICQIMKLQKFLQNFTSFIKVYRRGRYRVAIN